MESFTRLEQQVQHQESSLSHIHLLLGRMAEVVLKGEQVGQPNSLQQDDGAGGTNVSSGTGS